MPRRSRFGKSGALSLPKKLFIVLLTVMLGVVSAAPSIAVAASSSLDGPGVVAASAEPSANVEVSAEANAAAIEGCAYAADEFYRAQKGSNRPIDGTYRGYAYLNGSSSEYVVVAALRDRVFVYVPQLVVRAFDLDLASKSVQADLMGMIVALDKANEGGYASVTGEEAWYFTSELAIEEAGVVLSFSEEFRPDSFYTCVVGQDGSDITENADLSSMMPDHVDTLVLKKADDVALVEAPTGMDAVAEFFGKINFSPLWVTLKTTLTAIVIVFVLGLLAAWWILHLPKRAQDIADTIFTIPMVLPPTVCGFLLLLALGNNSPVGQWFAAHGIPLVLSWPATVIAATVVAFPLMYRSARGAFEGLDPIMLDAARTLGWSEGKIFFKLMLPLAWSGIAAGTVLAYARALGEFGATLFLAGNYVGVTQTISLAIYYQWMAGNWEVAVFWTIVMLLFSFLVILFINVWSNRTTKYRKKVDR